MPDQAEQKIQLNKKIEVEKELKGKPDEISIIRLVNSIVAHAFETQASDIHIDPEEKKVRVRLRIDGVLNDIFILPKEIPAYLRVWSSIFRMAFGLSFFFVNKFKTLSYILTLPIFNGKTELEPLRPTTCNDVLVIIVVIFPPD